MKGDRGDETVAAGMCSIRIERHGGSTVCRLEGELDRSNVASFEALVAAGELGEGAVVDLRQLLFLDLAGARAILRYCGPPAHGRLLVRQGSSSARLLDWMPDTSPDEQSAAPAHDVNGYLPAMDTEPDDEDPAPDDEVMADGRSYRSAADDRGEGLGDGSSYRDAAGDDEELGEADGSSYRQSSETDEPLGAADGSSYRDAAAQLEDAKEDST